MMSKQGLDWLILPRAAHLQFSEHTRVAKSLIVLVELFCIQGRNHHLLPLWSYIKCFSSYLEHQAIPSEKPYMVKVKNMSLE